MRSTLMLKNIRIASRPRARLLAIVLPLAGLLVAGCHPKNQTTDASTDAGPAVKDIAVQVETTGEADTIAVPEAKHGGSYTTWAGEYPKSLNQWLDFNSFSKQVLDLLFEPLITMHAVKDEPIGVLAQSWEISPDKKTYTFKIHPAAKWSDGKPVVAEDIQFYYDTIMNPKNLTSLFRVDMARFSRPEIVDEKTVRITANEPHWKNFWAAGDFHAFPKHVWEGKDFNAINFDFPVVSGPYAIDEVKTNRSISLKRRGDWWGRVLKYNIGKYNFDYLEYKAMADRNKALEALKKGDFDNYAIYTARIWAEQTDFPQVKKNWVIKQAVYNQEPVAFQGFALNMRRPLFQDLKVRQALSYLMNRELMNQKLMFNMYFLLNSYYPDLYPDHKNPDATFYNFDPEKARALLKEAGWQVNDSGVLTKNGQTLALTILHHGDDLRHINIYLQDLKAVGIQANVEVLSEATYQKRVDNHDYDLVWTNWSASRLRDPEQMWHSKTADEISTQNYAGVKDPEIDKLIDSQKEEMDGAKREQILKQIDKKLTEIVPYVLLWQSDRQKLLYWQKFGTPKSVLSKFDREDSATVYWWYDADKAAALENARKTDGTLPAAPAEVHYTE